MRPSVSTHRSLWPPPSRAASDALDLAASRCRGEHRHMAGDVGDDDQPLAVGGPIADVRPRVERLVATRASSHSPHRSASASGGTRSSANASCGSRRAFCRRERTAAIRYCCWSRRRRCACSSTRHRSAQSPCRSPDRRRCFARSPRPACRPGETSNSGSTDISRFASGVRSTRFFPSVRIRDHVRVRHVVVFVQPVIPMPDRLAA